MKLLEIISTALLLGYMLSMFIASYVTNLQTQGTQKSWTAARILMSVVSIALYALLFAVKEKSVWSIGVFALYAFLWFAFSTRFVLKRSITLIKENDASMFFRLYTLMFTFATAVFVGLIHMDVSKWIATLSKASTRMLILTIAIMLIVEFVIIVWGMLSNRFTASDIVKKIGFIHPGNIQHTGNAVNKTEGIPAPSTTMSPRQIMSLPDKFDCREQWSNAVSPLTNQYTCGSCVVNAATSMLSDRTAIAKGWPYAPALSVQYVLDCLAETDICPVGSYHHVILALLTRAPVESEQMNSKLYTTNSKYGGGTCTALCYPLTAGGSFELRQANKVLGWSNLVLFWTTVASLVIVSITRSLSYQPVWPLLLVLISGLLFMTSLIVSFTMIVPLLIKTGLAKAARIDSRRKCVSTCRDGGQPALVAFDKFALITEDSWPLNEKILAIKHEIYQSGPVLTSIQSKNLPGRTFGVYSYHSDEHTDHAVGIVGWGENYWIMRNSWGPDNGDMFDKGYYKIEFGSCRIEDSVWAGYVS